MCTAYNAMPNAGTWQGHSPFKANGQCCTHLTGHYTGFVDLKMGVFSKAEIWWPRRTLTTLVIWSNRRFPVRWFGVRWLARLLDRPPCMGEWFVIVEEMTNGRIDVSPHPHSHANVNPGYSWRMSRCFEKPPGMQIHPYELWLVCWWCEERKTTASTIHGFQRWMCVLFLLWCPPRPRWPLILDLLCVLLSRWSYIHECKCFFCHVYPY